jgi:hypothetical protein
VMVFKPSNVLKQKINTALLKLEEPAPSDE